MNIEKKEKVKTIAILLEPKQIEFLQKMAKENNVSVSAVARAIIQEKIKAEEKIPLTV